jgi:hypothetical protein
MQQSFNRGVTSPQLTLTSRCSLFVAFLGEPLIKAEHLSTQIHESSTLLWHHSSHMVMGETHNEGYEYLGMANIEQAFRTSNSDAMHRIGMAYSE